MGVMTTLPMLFNGTKARWERAGDSWEAQEDASGAILTSEDQGTVVPSNIVGPAEDPQRRFIIERLPKFPDEDAAGVDEYPWYVTEITFGDDRDDYGRMETHGGAVALIGQMLKGQRYGN